MRCHRKSNQAVSPEVAGCLRSTLADVPFKAATQHPGSSSPPSLLRWGCCSRMCIASFSNSSLLVLAWSITVASSHLIGWWFSHACSARANFSSAPFWHASGAPSSSSRASSLSPQCTSCHSCSGFGIPPWTSSPSPGCPSPWLAWSGGTVQT